MSAVVALVLVGSLAACAAGAGEAELPVPTFPASAQGADDSAAAEDSGLPDDCERLLPVADLGALLGAARLRLRPHDHRHTVAVRRPHGAAHLPVRRHGGRARPARGPSLNLDAGLYIDGAAAAEHWRSNVNAERGGARRDLQLGTAPAVLVERSGEALLTTVNGPGTVTLVLPSRIPSPAGVPRRTRWSTSRLRTLAAVTPPPSSAARPALS